MPRSSTLYPTGLTAIVLAVFGAACTHITPASAQPLSIAFRNSVPLPTSTTDQFGQSFTVTGMSGITRLAGDDYLAVMDNSNKLIRLHVQVSATGEATTAQVLGGITIAQSHDFEAIALAPSIVYLAEEGTPAVRTFAYPAGTYLTTLPTPPVFLSRRSNNGFESLARMPDGVTMWTANEQALTVDGPAATQSIGTTVRLVRYANNVPAEQYAYHAEPMHGAPISGSKAGVCEMLGLPDGRLLVMERSLATNLSGIFLTRIYLVELTAATNIATLPGLIGQTYTPAAKTLVYSGDHQNLEGLVIGPQLGPGRYAMLGVVDDGDPVSVNRLVAFEIAGIGPCYANCDGSTSTPVLNITDFACFINQYAAGSSSANCDGSSVPPTLNVQDFACYLNAFADGCP